MLTFERQNKQALKTAMSLSNIDTWEKIFVTEAEALDRLPFSGAVLREAGR